MKLAFRKEQAEAADPKELPQALGKYRKKHEFFLVSINALLQFIKDFSLDIKEIKSEVFKKDINELKAKFKRDEKLKKTQSSFHKHKKRIRKFIDRQKQYLAEREKELKDIIDLLTKAMVTLDTDNQLYHQKIFEQSEKIEQITRLDDMKKIKQALKQELENLQQTVRDKQNRDCKKLKSLSKKVNTLNHELKRAKVDSLMDGLTGIYNRKAFDRYLQELMSRDAFTHVSFALLMMDIDNFKDIND
ncbi:MAG: diguanylate cyclase, partial [Desulfobacterales bacterium]|nr:diguanylate cyclase [Desulfobacterales bacterium]